MKRARQRIDTTGWPPELADRMRKLREILRRLAPVAVGFSGGVDSSFLLWTAVAELGRGVIAITGESPTLPSADRRNIAALVAELGVEHVRIRTRQMELENFAANPPDRCYYCKRELFSAIREEARRHGIAHVLEAGNRDDLADYRPGRRALAELGIRSPLIEAGFRKRDVRDACRRLGLSFAERPASACLASRIPYGRRITVADLRMVDEAEELLRRRGFMQVRVRHHGDVARIEVGAGEVGRLLDDGLREEIVVALRRLGFRYVAVDLRGYRPGSLNDALPGSTRRDTMRAD